MDFASKQIEEKKNHDKSERTSTKPKSKKKSQSERERETKSTRENTHQM